MAGQKGKQSVEQSKSLYVVVVTNPTLTQVIVGPFTDKHKAQTYLKTLPPALTTAVARIMPPKVLDEYLGN